MKSSSKKIGFWFGFLGAILFGGLQILTIERSASSTAAIGYIFLPIPMILAFIVFFLFGFSLGAIKEKRSIVALIYVVALTGFLGKEVITGLMVMKKIPEIQSAQSSEALESFLQDKNKFVIGIIAQNKYASPELLDRIAHLDDPELFEAMGSLFPVMGDNGKGLAVMRLVVRHPNVAPSTLDFLATQTNVDYVLSDIAGNSKTSESTLRKLNEKNNYLIDWGLAQNHSTPKDLFHQLLERKKDYTQRTTLSMLVNNPAVDPEVKSQAEKLLNSY